VSRRARAVAFGVSALACAGLAASIAGGYRGEIESQLGPLRTVLVAGADLPAGRALHVGADASPLELRRIPARFVPPGALHAVEEAAGLAPMAPVPAGAYLLAAQLRPPGRGHRGRSPGRLPPGREPVELAVSGAEPLAAAGDPAGMRVDVIVTSEPEPGRGPGRTYVAAEAVRLLALDQGGDRSGGPGVLAPPAWTATLALSRDQALRLIQAENFARQLRLIPASGR
jgi:Flp pilus assembly protein CpaB